MDNQSEIKLCNRKTYTTAAVSALVAGALAFAVCSVQENRIVLDHSTRGNVSDSHTDAPTTLLTVKAG